MAQYQRSLADSAASKHGEALTRLQIAEAAAKEAHRFATSFSAAFTTLSSSGGATLPSDAAVSLLEMTKTHLALCSEARTSEQRDNDLIYHEAQPSEAALPPIEKSSVGDPIPIQEVYGAPEVQKVVGQDIFIRLVPLSVHQSSSLYSEEKAKLVRTEGERCEMADTELTTTLDYMSLPASLDKFNDAIFNGGRSTRLNELAEPPPQVLEWADDIQRAAGSKSIDQMCHDMISLRDKTHRNLETLERLLDTDARECEQMRVRYDHLWEQPPALNFTKPWRQNIKSHRETLEMARQSDHQVEALWASTKADIQILVDPSGEALRALYAQALVRDDAANAPSLLDVADTSDDEAEIVQLKNLVQSIQENLSRLQSIKKERQGVLQDLKERIQADDISQLLILNRKAQNIEPALFSAELEKFRAHSGRISATLHLQTSTIQELTAQYKSLVEGKRGKALEETWTHASKRRAKMTSRFQRAQEVHEEIRNGLSKGTQFYREVSGAVEELEKEVDEFIRNRTAERVQLAAKAEAEKERRPDLTPSSKVPDLQALEQRLSGMHMSSQHPQAHYASRPAPPPLPPPPAQASGWQTAQHTGPTPTAYPAPHVPAQNSGPSQATYAHPPTQFRQATSPGIPSHDPYAGLGSFGTQAPPTGHENAYARYQSSPALPPPPPPISYQSTGAPRAYAPPPQPPQPHRPDTQYYPPPQTSYPVPPPPPQQPSWAPSPYPPPPHPPPHRTDEGQAGAYGSYYAPPPPPPPHGQTPSAPYGWQPPPPPGKLY